MTQKRDITKLIDLLIYSLLTNCSSCNRYLKKTDRICMISCELTKIRMDFTLKDILIQYLEIYCKTFSICSTIPSLWFLVQHLLETGAIVSFQLKIPFYDFCVVHLCIKFACAADWQIVWIFWHVLPTRFHAYFIRFIIFELLPSSLFPQKCE